MTMAQQVSNLKFEKSSHMRTRTPLLVFATCCWLALCGSAAAQDQQEDLAKTIQNPLASLVSLPFQANYNNGVGEHDRLFECVPLLVEI